MGQGGSRDLFIDRVFMIGHAQAAPYLRFFVAEF